eukprot:446856_1
MNSNCFNFQNIKSLRLVRFGDIGDVGLVPNWFNIDKFYRLFIKFPIIECLELVNCFIPLTFKASKLKQLYPNLNGLSITAGLISHSNDLINEFGNNLHF